MKFTLTFRTKEDVDLSYGLASIPCVTFVRGSDPTDVLYVDGKQRGPDYVPGAVRRLLDRDDIESLLADEVRECVVTVFPEGHGTRTHLRGLLADL